MDLVGRLEAEYLPRLQSMAAVLRERRPELRFEVGAGPVGELTEYQGHDIYLECTFVGRSADRSDCVTLTISLCHLNRTPRLMADVAWGAPEATVEDSIDLCPEWTTQDQWPEADASTLRHLEQVFPRLLQTFKQAVARGGPP